jgi:hypothetical protein
LCPGAPGYACPTLAMKMRGRALPASFLTPLLRKIRFAVSAGVRAMPKGEQRGNREAKKPKKEKAKTSAAAPSTKGSVGAAVDSKAGSKR